MKFTEANVLKIRAKDKDLTIWEETLPNFGIRCRKGGTVGTYIIRYTVKGQPDKRMSLGKVGSILLKDAQIAARNALNLVTTGIDPAAKREETAEARKVDAKNKFIARVEPFLKELGEGRPGKKPRSADYVKAVRRSLMVFCADFHEKGLDTIKRAAVVDLLDEVAENVGWRRSGTLQAHLASFYGHCRRKGYEGNNPVSGTERRNSVARDRLLSDEEIKLLWAATEEPTNHNRIVRLLLLTAMRRGVFGGLKRDMVDHDRMLIDIKEVEGMMKNGHEFLLPLSRQVYAILKEAARATNSDFLFGSTPDTRFSTWSDAKEVLDAKIAELNGGKPIAPWVLHDLRRTFRTNARKRAGIVKDTAELCLFHVGEAKSGISGVYDKDDNLDLKQVAMQSWADFIYGLVEGKPERKAA